MTKRQKQILDRVIQEYINLAKPISSQFLERNYNFGICPASIRIEMHKLTKKGYLYQSHTSAGRIPTDKGYRFFVNQLIEKGTSRLEEEFKIEKWFEKKINNPTKFIQLLTKNLAAASSTLVLSYLPKTEILWKEGWERVLREPEFRDTEYIFNFVDFLNEFEKGIEDFVFTSGVSDFQITIYIGKENPFPRAKNFSIIFSRCQLPNQEEGVISLLGPKRMAYERNISLMNSLMKVLKNF